MAWCEACPVNGAVVFGRRSSQTRAATSAGRGPGRWPASRRCCHACFSRCGTHTHCGDGGHRPERPSNRCGSESQMIPIPRTKGECQVRFPHGWLALCCARVQLRMTVSDGLCFSQGSMVPQEADRQLLATHRCSRRQCWDSRRSRRHRPHPAQARSRWSSKQRPLPRHCRSAFGMLLLHKGRNVSWTSRESVS